MPLRPLTEPFSVSAEWFLPDKPDRTLNGQLHYTLGRISLELNDTFAPLQGAIFGNETLNYDRIYGRTRSGHQFTLLYPQRMGLSLNFGPSALVQPDHFDASALVVGALTTADPILSDLSCRVPGLALWLSRPTVDSTCETTPVGLSMTFRVASLPDETIRIPALSSNIVFDVNSTAKPSAYSLNVETIGSWRLRPDSPQPLSWYLRYIPAISAFLSFCAGTVMSPDCVTIPNEILRERSSVLFRRPTEKYCTVSDPRFFFLTRGAFAAQFEQCLSRWFELYPKIETTCSLTMSIFASDGLWPHVEFLSLMQALEGFHRAQYDGLYMPEKDYRAVADALTAAIPSIVGADHRTSLKSRIQYGNEVALGKRLTLLCEGLAKSIRIMLYGDSPRLLRRWIDTRNYYTHWDEDLRGEILDGQGLIYAIARLRSLLRVLYLAAAGVPQEIIYQALAGVSSEAQFLIQIRGAERRAADPTDTTGAIMFIQRDANTASSGENVSVESEDELDSDTK